MLFSPTFAGYHLISLFPPNKDVCGTFQKPFGIFCGQRTGPPKAKLWTSTLESMLETQNMGVRLSPSMQNQQRIFTVGCVPLNARIIGLFPFMHSNENLPANIGLSVLPVYPASSIQCRQQLGLVARQSLP